MKTLPCVHMNGTSAQMLFNGYLNALKASNDLLEAMDAIEFNQRDYYPLGTKAWTDARNEMAKHRDNILAAQHAFMAVAAHVQEVAGDKLK